MKQPAVHLTNSIRVSFAGNYFQNKRGYAPIVCEGLKAIRLYRLSIGHRYPQMRKRLLSTAIADLILPEDTAVIEANVFEADMAITSVDARNCTSIGDNAFLGCTGLERIRLPLNCTIGTDAFKGTALNVIYGPAGGMTESWAIQHGILFVPEETETGPIVGDYYTIPERME